ncbi:helix-turn-helix transcriptional regulator [Agrobacterium vitis]|uniref:helix-turn-helix domain-containing protein n=1 Tax=Allorhizobium ampelinum TaxID=3025782 RepID=UPI001F203A20|nr:AraC family transcriptional regulator [Allorhizobium ampelinum]MCF1464039.1 helix-turn-helix transcriptional regulator [Allorhizobium ampelinum]
MNVTFTVVYIGPSSSVARLMADVVTNSNISVVDRKALNASDSTSVAIVDRRTDIIGGSKGKSENLLPSAVSLALVSEQKLDRNELFSEGFLDYIVWPLLEPELVLRLETAHRKALQSGTAFHSTDPLVQKVCDLMARRLAEPLELATLVQFAGTNRTTLISRFHKAFGCGPLTWRRNRRMAEAARLLREGQQSISDIAAAVGYENSNNFSTAFRAVHGQSPRTYRNKALRKENA